VNNDADELAIIETEADDFFDEGDQWAVHTDMKELHDVKISLEASGLKISEANLVYVPKMTVKIAEEDVQAKVMKLMDALDELDDVVETHTNFDIA
jgi:transcriptional/translational regulatory protein YebC/TACO1